MRECTKSSHLYTLTPLHLAVDKNDFEMVKFLSSKNVSMAKSSKSGLTPLHFCAKRGNLEIFMHLTALWGEKNPTSTGHLTPLHLAAKFGHLNIVKYLLESKSQNCYAQDLDGWTCLHYAVKFKHFQVVEFILKNLNLKQLSDNRGLNPFHFALESQDLNLVKLFLPQNGNESFKKSDGKLTNPAHFAVEIRNLELLKAVFNEEKLNGWSLMHSAAFSADLKILKFLYEKNPNSVHDLTCDGKTPLHLAAMKNNVENVKFLVEKTENVQIQDRQGQTPLDYASKRGNLKIVKILEQ